VERNLAFSIKVSSLAISAPPPDVVIILFPLKENIDSRPLWKPMHLQPVFSEFPSYLNNCSAELFEKGLCLPSGSNLSDSERKRVLNAIIGCLT